MADGKGADGRERVGGGQDSRVGDGADNISV